MRSILFGIVFLLFMSGIVEAQAWTPPEIPIPIMILREVAVDREAKRYEVALAKCVWYHNYAMENRDRKTSVSPTMVIPLWHDLAIEYEPAMDLLIQTRDELRDKALEADHHQVFRPLHSYYVICRKMKEESKTQSLFHEIEQQGDQKKSKFAFNAARRALMSLEDYETLGRYIDPEEDLDRLSDLLRISRRFAKERGDQFGTLDLTERRIIDDTAFLVTTLVKNDRLEEAKQLVERAKKEWDDAKYHAALDKALVDENE
jgi:hypothetical protein